MVSKQHLTLKQLAIVGFFFATLFLLLGLFLSTVNPVKAQTGATGTATSGVSGGMSSTATSGVAVTGSTTARNSVDFNQLKNFTVVDRDGNKVGNVVTFLFDLRNAAVCAPTTGSTGGVSGAATSVATSAAGAATAVTTGSSGTMTGWSACKVTNASQTAGQVAFVVVSRSAVSMGGTAGSATAVATGTAGAQFTGDNVVIPWRMVRINLDQQTLIVDAPVCVFSTAPGYDTANVPDFFTGAFASAVTTFWANPSTQCSAGVPVTGGAQATSMVTSTAEPTSTTAVVATTAPTTSGVVATTAPTSAMVATTAAPSATSVAVTPSETVAVSPTVASTSAVGGVSGATATVPATMAAPGVSGSPTALVPVTGIDLSQVQEAAVAQRRMILDIGIVGVGLVLLALGVIIKTGKH